VRVAKAGKAISATKSMTTSLVPKKDTLIHLMKTRFAYDLALILTLYPAMQQYKNRSGNKMGNESGTSADWGNPQSALAFPYSRVPPR
jgi:hypothetical protein